MCMCVVWLSFRNMKHKESHFHIYINIHNKTDRGSLFRVDYKHNLLYENLISYPNFHHFYWNELWYNITTQSSHVVMTAEHNLWLTIIHHELWPRAARDVNIFEGLTIVCRMREVLRFG